MKRLYEPGAYGPAAPWWAETVTRPDWPSLAEDITVEVAVIGGGFTGLNCALALAGAGVDVAVLDAERPGWGASGRNGGFCCIGGAMAPEGSLRRRYGAAALTEWQTAQGAAIDHVAGLLDTHGIDADRHSEGETVLAHTPRAFRALRAEAAEAAATWGVASEVLTRDDLAAQGLGGPWHGGMTLRRGFALNPAKYHAGLARVATRAGVRGYGRSPVASLDRNGDGWRLGINGHSVRARRVVLATNGYSSEDLPDWLRARTLPVQSSVIVTRPLTGAEAEAAGWTSDQMAYDTRRLLHYFRRLPDGRFLFGMRGGLTARAEEQIAVSRRIRTDFHATFPAWRGVEITHEWSGLVCFLASGHPFAGAVPGCEGLHAALGFHGNGVAMGSYLGHCLGEVLAHGRSGGPMPAFLGQEPRRFPLGRHRRALLRPAYWLAETFDL
ncbi:NAD(P)/FAD-dependent oxidoreductase [Sagittula salina]|uniref:FAD-binding oxidoreductase n=1 Tax=Sagittula salina TaxID=2820268 RepID=A0A940S1J8_9RHOB|nr:FAD-binding oxidoreductase [Sagittula salina]